MVETNFDKFKGKDYRFVAHWLKTKGLHKPWFRVIMRDQKPITLEASKFSLYVQREAWKIY